MLVCMCDPVLTELTKEAKDRSLWNLFVVCSALSESLSSSYDACLLDSGLIQTTYSIKNTNEHFRIPVLLYN